MADLNVNSISNAAENGAPDFSHMPTVSGDPVVESGSNSDGSWTRWADGTQKTKTVGVNSPSGFVTRILPLEYIDADFQIGGSLFTSSSAANASLNVNGRTTTTVSIAAVANGAFVTGSNTVWSTFGRWK